MRKGSCNIIFVILTLAQSLKDFSEADHEEGHYGFFKPVTNLQGAGATCLSFLIIVTLHLALNGHLLSALSSSFS